MIEMAMQVDRLGRVLSWSSNTAQRETLQSGVIQLSGSPWKLDVTVSVEEESDGDDQGPMTRRYRATIDDRYYCIGAVETKRGRRTLLKVRYI
jgi:hypothetical protein